MASPDKNAVKDSIRAYLARHSTLSLATCDSNRAWSNNLFYASDDCCELYFMSSGTTRHCQNIASNPQVSASISGEFSDWEKIKGLQLDGVAGVVPEYDRDSVVKIYLDKFPSLRNLYHFPTNEQDKQIVARILNSHFYRISPKWIRLIDNSKGFGYREEITF